MNRDLTRQIDKSGPYFYMQIWSLLLVARNLRRKDSGKGAFGRISGGAALASHSGGAGRLSRRKIA